MNTMSYGRWIGLFIALLGFTHCLSQRDLKGFPCPQDRTCPVPLICREGRCVDPLLAEQTQEPSPSDATEPGKEPSAEVQPDRRQPPETRPEPRREVQPDVTPELRRESPPERPPAERQPEPRSEPKPDKPFIPLVFQQDSIYLSERRSPWGIAGKPGTGRYLIAGFKDQDKGFLFKGPDYGAMYHWPQAYATSQGLFDVIWAGSSGNSEVFVAVGHSRQKGTQPHEGPIIHSPSGAFAANWNNVDLRSIPEATTDKASLRRLAADLNNGVILAVGTTDLNGGSAAKGLVLESRDQGKTWIKSNLRSSSATQYHDAAFSSLGATAGAQVTIVGDRGDILRGAANSGPLRWQTFPTPTSSPSDAYLAIAVVPPKDLVVSVKTAQDAHSIHYFDDAAYKWRAASHPGLQGQISDFAVAPDGMVLAVGDAGQVLRSDDKGRSWKVVNSGTSKRLHRALFIDGRLFVTGESTILSATYKP